MRRRVVVRGFLASPKLLGFGNVGKNLDLPRTPNWIAFFSCQIMKTAEQVVFRDSVDI